MYPDLGGFAAANGWQRPLRRDRLPSAELTDSYLPVAINLGKGASADTSVRDWSAEDLLRAARRELSISAVRIGLWLKEPEHAPQYWAAYHADEVIAVFRIDKSSWRESGPGRYICDLTVTRDPEALAALGRTFIYEGKPMRIAGRAVFVAHTKPRV